jgi:malate dehydrogenase (oxaloacetate-decarboxylating)
MTRTDPRATVEELLAKAKRPAADAMRLHPFYRGKIQMVPKCPVRSLDDFSIWYTPGVAAPCRAIQAEPDLVYEHTGKGNTIAVVSDGTRVLGLGDIGPEAALPVMEGKALLFKYLGGVDAIPICLATRNADEIVRTVELLAPSFGGINLEDISQPKCFDVLARLRSRLRIPVWHDDQQGTGTVLLAALLNALEVVGKRLGSVRIALIGAGAANAAVYRFLRSAGVDPAAVIACDSQGTLHRNRSDIAERRDEYAEKWRLCTETNPDAVGGGIAGALRGADVCIAFSTPTPGTIQPEWVRSMAERAIVFACANPVPEIWPWDATEAGAAIVATGRSDFENQVNNSLGFPGIFRGALDVRASSISDEMGLAAARALAEFARRRGIDEHDIVPRMDEWEVFVQVAVATATQAIEQGLARRPLAAERLIETVRTTILRARAASEALMSAGVIAAAECA